IHLEMYIVHNDGIGRRFRDALVARAKAGVTVRVLYDWFGALRPSSFRFWAPLVNAGGDVRVANAPRFHTLFNFGSRDHRKLLTVDGRVAYIGGLCIGDDWLGDPARQIPPGETPGWSCAGRPCPRPSSPLPVRGRPGARACRPAPCLRARTSATRATSGCVWSQPHPTAPRCIASNWPHSPRPTIASG
ncbi:MAG: hypothetical protein JJE40_20360, partial [Vicinamibacteria bacterium]|nr:hypothetical protein [Vicinamibacteria bacterium]